MPTIKQLAAVGGAIFLAEFAGNKLAAKVVGPELPGESGLGNNVKEYAAIIGVGLASYVVLAMVLKV